MENPFKDLGGGGFEDFQPKVKQTSELITHEPRPSRHQLQRIAAEQGFQINNLPVQRKALKSGRTTSKDPAQPMSLRLRVGDWNRFSAFCERNEYSVADGFAVLAELAEKL